VARGFACGLPPTHQPRAGPPLTSSAAKIHLKVLREGGGVLASRKRENKRKNSSLQLLLLDSHTCPLGTAPEQEAGADGHDGALPAADATRVGLRGLAG
jgi:hypothetical protein